MKKKNLGKTIAIIIAFMMVLSISALVKNGSKTAYGAGTKLQQIKKSGKIIIGTSADYPPYEFHKLVNGKDTIVGFDVKIAEEIAKDLGVKLEFKDMSFDGLLAALQTGKVDMIIAGMNPTPERKKKVDFSKVYYQAVQSIMVRTEDKGKYKSIADFKGKKIGVQKGTTQESLAKEQITGASIKSLGKVTDLILQFKNDKVDGLVVELPVATSYASKNKDITVTKMQLKNEVKGAAVAVKKNSPDLIKSINKTLDKLMKSKSIDKFVTDANNMVE